MNVLVLFRGLIASLSCVGGTDSLDACYCALYLKSEIVCIYPHQKVYSTYKSDTRETEIRKQQICLNKGWINNERQHETRIKESYCLGHTCDGKINAT